MTCNLPSQLIAADVGNSAIKLGRFQVSESSARSGGGVELQLDEVYRIVGGGQKNSTPIGADLPPERLQALVHQLLTSPHHWYVASVNRELEGQLAAWIENQRPQDEYLVLSHEHFPQETDVHLPDQVGTDRLAAAVAANERRAPKSPAIVVDAGTAITVDLVTSDGVFRGGAILAGFETAAAALASVTEALPLLQHFDFSSAPNPIGKSTEEAIRSGIVWGCVGAVREHITRIAASLPVPPEIYSTGGDGAHLARLIGQDLTFDPNLVLRGIALTGSRHLQSRST